MKRTLRPLSYLVLLLVLLGSCSKKSNVPVPADAGIVFHIDGGSLNSKLSWDEFKQGELYKLAKEELAGKHDEFAMTVLENPDSSGIDIKSDLYIFARVRGKGGYFAVTCAVKDANALTRLIQQIHPTKTIIKSGDYSVLKMGDDAVTTWNSDRFVFVANASGMNGSTSFNGGSSRQKLSEDSLLYFAKEVYDINGSSSIANNDHFSDMMKDKADAHFFFNASKFYSGDSNPIFTMLPKMSMLLEGNATTFSLNFGDGKMTADGKSYASKEMTEFYSKYKAKNLDADALKKIPGNNVAAAFAMNYPPEGLKAFFGLIGLDGLINAYLAKLNYSFDDFVKANKGDMFIAVSDFSIGEKEVKYTIDGEEHSYKSTKPDVKVLFGSSINDKPSFDKLMGILQNKVLAEGGPTVQAMAGNIPYAINNNWFVAGSDSAIVHSFGSTTTDHPFISKISGHPMGGYIDIQRFITGTKPSLAGDSSATLMFNESVKMWKDIVFYGGEKDGDATKTHFEINLVDPSTNSLKQLHNYLGKMAKIEKDEKERRKREWSETTAPAIDSTITVSPH